METLPDSKNKPRVTLQPTPKERKKSYRVPKGSPPLYIKSAYPDKKLFVTTRDFGKWMRGEYPLSERDSNNYIHELAVKEFKENLIIQTVQKPDEVLKIIDIHYNQTECNLYIKNHKNNSGKEKKFLVLSDPKSGKVKVASRVTKEEYNHLKKTGQLDLFDLRRNPQSRVMNQKGIQEAEILSRAQDQGYLTEIDDIRRPYNLSESNSDYVGKDRKGSKVEIDTKAIDGSGRRPLNKQTKDINESLIDLFEDVDDPTKLQIICDLSAKPAFLHEDMIKNITKGLDSKHLDNINFLVD